MNTEDLLALLQENSRQSDKDLADALGCSENDVKARLTQLEEQNVIVRYSAVINEQALENNHKMRALIELNVRPEKEFGYTKIARQLQGFKQVTDVVLTSGRFDFLLTVEGDSIQDISDVVTTISTLEEVLHTATHFILRPFKIAKVPLSTEDSSPRLQISL